jgi:hypothetical protein
MRTWVGVGVFDGEHGAEGSLGGLSFFVCDDTVITFG